MENVGFDKHPAAIEHCSDCHHGEIGIKITATRTVKALDAIQNDAGCCKKKPAPAGTGTGN